MKSLQSHFFRCLAVGIAVASFSVGVVNTSTAQPDVARADTVMFDDLPALERARQFLVARQFQAALTAAEEAAEERGIPSASMQSQRYQSASRDTASLHLYRGLSLELQRMFPEAVADYDAFLALEHDSWRSEELLKRYPYVSGQAVRFQARALSDSGAVPDSGASIFAIGVFPLYNASNILVMSQLSFGLTGVLSNTLGILDHFSDQHLPQMPYSQLRLLLDEILPDEVHGPDSQIEVGSLTRILDVRFLATGVLDEVSGSLTGDARLGDAADLSTDVVAEIQSSYTAEGLLDLQRTLSLTIADSIQSRTGFNYVPSRQAYADSVEKYLVADVGQLLTYGFAVEQLILGEPVEAQALMLDLPDLVAQRDLQQFEEIGLRSTPPVDNLIALTSLTPVAAAPPVVEPETTTVDTTITQAQAEPGDGGAPSATQLQTRTAHVVSAAAARHLSGFGLWGPTQRPLVFDEVARDDPRKGVAGTLDPTRRLAGESGIPVEVVIPLPPAADAPQKPGR